MLLIWLIRTIPGVQHLLHSGFDAEDKEHHQSAPYADQRHASDGRMPHKRIAQCQLRRYNQHNAQLRPAGQSLSLGIAFQVLLIHLRGNKPVMRC